MRILKPGGRLFVSTPNYTGLMGCIADIFESSVVPTLKLDSRLITSQHCLELFAGFVPLVCESQA